MPPELYQALATLCIGIGSLSSAFVAFVGYKLQRREKDKSWLQVFRELYSKFWSDSHMARVRSWLACDASYEELEPVLAKRLKLERIDPHEYEVLESLDRFCALVMEMLQMVPRNREQEILHGQLIDRYWLNKVRERELFRKYVERSSGL